MINSKSYRLFFALILIFLSASANAFYLGGSAGVSASSTEDTQNQGISTTSDTGIGFNIAVLVGRRSQNRHWRTEIELSRRHIDFDLKVSGNVSGVNVNGSSKIKSEMTALLVSSYYYFMPENKVSPYLGVGIGYANTDEKAEGTVNNIPIVISVDDSGIVYQVAVGAAYKMAPTWTMRAGYQYLGEYDAHEFRVGFYHDF